MRSGKIGLMSEPLDDPPMNNAFPCIPCFVRQEVCQEADTPAALTRIALAGNLIDAAAKTGLMEMDVCGALCRACRDRVSGSASALFRAADRAEAILYLTDNAGEIVFDRVLIEALPKTRIRVGVRGSPVINDATMADAETAGLPDIVPVLSNGSDAPGTILEDCSDDFRRAFDASDLIIAKGQGNYESLCATSKHVFFLLRIKCSTVAAHMGAPLDTMVIDVPETRTWVNQ